MKHKRTMNEALTAAKELRKNLNQSQPETQPDADSHLRVVESTAIYSNILQQDTARNDVLQNLSSNAESSHQSSSQMISQKQIWVRHTIGLRDTTSLSLRDAADGQKRKERYGELGIGEPANEQEIADLGITLALQQLGYLS